MPRVVINITNEAIEAFKNASNIYGSYYDYNSVIGNAIKNGTILPKGHGRLIDADNLPMDIEWSDIESAQTVIKADRWEENG